MSGWILVIAAGQGAKTPTRRDAQQPLLRMIFHEAGYFGELLCSGVIRQRLEKNSTILHPLNPVIEDRQNAAVRFRANQPAEALFERQHRLRNLVLPEGVAAVFLQSTHPRGHNRITRHGEW